MRKLMMVVAFCALGELGEARSLSLDLTGSRGGLKGAASRLAATFNMRSVSRPVPIPGPSTA